MCPIGITSSLDVNETPSGITDSEIDQLTQCPSAISAQHPPAVFQSGETETASSSSKLFFRKSH
jgi:hypothetical protein